MKSEIKNSILKTPFHLIRFLGLFIIPLIYGFSYIFAFYDPFTKVDQVDAAIVTHKTDDKGEKDFLGDALGKILSQEQQVQMGEINMTMKMKHIYAEDQDVNKVVDDNYATMVLPSMNAVDASFVKYINGLSISTVAGVIDVVTQIKEAVAALKNTVTGMKMHLNDKKNYLLAFGIQAAPYEASTISTLANVLAQAFKDETYKQHVKDAMIAADNTISKANAEAKYQRFLEGIDRIGLENFAKHDSFVAMDSYMGGEKAKYGYGLAPFFISVAMWIGAMVMTFAIHRKIYDKDVMPGVRYFVKWLLIIFGTTMQATLLMTALYFVGFRHLGMSHWLYMYGTAVISGIVFGSIVQAMRFSIHNRNLSILFTIILLVIQMASAGGLFPIDTQSGFYKGLNKIVPMGRTVTMFREASFDTDWGTFLSNFGYLSIWLLWVPIGIWINWRRTVKIYIKQGFTMPPKMHNLYTRRARRKAAKGGVN